MYSQGSKKVLPGCLGQVDFPVGQVTFHSHLPNGQGPRQVVCQLNHKKSNLRLAHSKQNLRATCPKGKLEFKFFSSPDSVHITASRYPVMVMSLLYLNKESLYSSPVYSFVEFSVASCCFTGLFTVHLCTHTFCTV